MLRAEPHPPVKIPAVIQWVRFQESFSGKQVGSRNPNCFAALIAGPDTAMNCARVEGCSVPAVHALRWSVRQLLGHTYHSLSTLTLSRSWDKPRLRFWS